jgi:hypothetical protein
MVNFQSVIIIFIFFLIIGSGYFLIKSNNTNSNPNSNPSIICPPGQVPENGECNCPSGETKDNNGNCVKKPIPPPPPPGSICNNHGHKGSDGKCVCDKNYSGDNCEIVCNNNGNIVNDQCVCLPGFEGIYCQCDDSKKPTNNLIDTCKGLGYECQLDGSWKDVQASSCTEIYDMNGGTEQTWLNKCSNLCNPNDNKNIDPKYNYELTCGEPSAGSQLWGCLQQCRIEPNINAGDCSSCNGIKGTPNQTCYCDPTTTDNKWVCRQDDVTSCPPSSETPKGLCIATDGSHFDPDCIKCGNKLGYIWQCKGALENPICVKDFYDMSQENTTSVNNVNGSTKQVTWYWDGRDGATTFPTINNDICDSRVNNSISPFSTLEVDSTYGPQWQSINSQAGWVSGLSTSGSKDKSTLPFYFDDINDRNLIKYNIVSSNYKCNDGSESVPGKCLTKSGSVDPNTKYCNDKTPPYSSTDQCSSGVKQLDSSKIKYAIAGKYGEGPNSTVFNNNSGCMKFPSDYCQNGGIFTQYCFDSQYNLTSCNNSDPNNPNYPLYRDEGGYCTCSVIPNYVDKNGNHVTYKGQFCQYSDTETCNSNGTVDDNGNCTCHQYISQTDGQTKTYLGEYCQYSDNYCDKGFTTYPSNDPNNGGKTIYGIGIANSDGTCNYDCSKVMPRCATCSGNTNLTSGQVGHITCLTPANPFDGNNNKNGNIFDNCVPISTDQSNPSALYGCQVVQDPTPWTPYVGASCKYHDGDWKACLPGSATCRIVNLPGEDPDYCYNYDFTTTNYNWDTHGLDLSQKAVSGLGAYEIDNRDNNDTNAAGIVTTFNGWEKGGDVDAGNSSTVSGVCGNKPIIFWSQADSYTFGTCPHVP